MNVGKERKEREVEQLLKMIDELSERVLECSKQLSTLANLQLEITNRVIRLEEIQGVGYPKPKDLN